jgi:hypothetical protein
MFRPSAVRQGFDYRRVLAASHRRNIVAASLAIGSLSLGLMVALTVLSMRIAAAMPA